ncbi:MAG TPA: T9SS type A sorting domain-containing protein [Flavisolibacter sp.]|nr:T9SS type A sorting domain-containing protein [Flavisolibacter sp.]
MKQILSICLLLCGLAARSQDPAYTLPPPAPQNIVAAEYYIDLDPGFGNGTPISLTPGTELAGLAPSINTAGLSNGIHRLFIRARNAEGAWSLSTMREFIVDFDPAYINVPAVVQDIVAAEYFIDADPGFGNATALPLTAAADISNLVSSINTAGLSTGTHRLYLRTRSNGGAWSLTTVREFVVDFDPAYTAAPAAAQNMAAAEYFIDTDPGFGNATAIALPAAANVSALVASISTTGLSVGAHRLYLRSRSTDGHWSITAVRDFIVDVDPAYTAAPAAPGNITYAEYFLDTDPGFGNGTAVTLSPGVDLSNLAFAVNTTGLADGQHTLYVRSRNDWSLTAYANFIVGTVLPLRFLSFAAINREQWTDLQWETADEVATSHFVVERSADARSWTALGQVNSRNLPGRQVYQFRDSLPLNGPAYYRLRQVDIDGGFVYSKILLVNRQSGPVQVFPNPVVSEVQVSLKRPMASVHIDLVDGSGRLLKSFAFAAPGTLIRLSLADVPAGLYQLRVRSGKEEWVKQVLKQ